MVRPACDRLANKPAVCRAGIFVALNVAVFRIRCVDVVAVAQRADADAQDSVDGFDCEVVRVRAALVAGIVVPCAGAASMILRINGDCKMWFGSSVGRMRKIKRTTTTKIVMSFLVFE